MGVFSLALAGCQGSEREGVYSCDRTAYLFGSLEAPGIISRRSATRAGCVGKGLNTGVDGSCSSGMEGIDMGCCFGPLGRVLVSRRCTSMA